MENLSFLRYYLPFSLILAINIAFGWHFAGLSLWESLSVFLTVIFAMLPTGLLLAVRPALRRGRRRGLIQGFEFTSSWALHPLAQVDTLALAKNGVVTSGHPYIKALIGEGTSKLSLLSLAASVERKAAHPVGKAIYATALHNRCRLQLPSALSELPGLGVEGLIARTPVRVGKGKWLQEEGVQISAALLTQGDQIACQGLTPLYVSNGRHCRGIIVMADDMPEGTAGAIRKLRKLGLHTILLTGEGRRVANAIREEADMDEARANLTAEGKAREVQLLRAKGKTIALAGEWTRDELALKEADVRIALLRPQGMPGSPLDVTAKDTAAEATEPTGRSEEGSIHSEDSDENTPVYDDSTYDLLVHSGRLASIADAIALARHTTNVIRTGKVLSLVGSLLLALAATGLPRAFGLPFLPPYAAIGLNFFLAGIIFLNARRA